MTVISYHIVIKEINNKLQAVNWKLEHFYEMMPDLVISFFKVDKNDLAQIMILLAELIVDWLKHAFITKFNEISALVYRGIITYIIYLI